MSPIWANSALLETELTLISSMESVEGNISVITPLDRTLMEEIPSIVEVAWKGAPPAMEILPPPESVWTPGVNEMEEKTELDPPARKLTGRLSICAEVLESTMVEESVWMT